MNPGLLVSRQIEKVTQMMYANPLLGPIIS
jgi:hypothetical protein